MTRRQEEINKLREHFQEIFDALKVPEAVFIPRFFYSTAKGLVTNVFESEMKINEVFFTEICDLSDEDGSLVPTDRKLYIYTRHLNWETTYQSKINPNSKSKSYMIPFDQFKLVELPKEEPKKLKQFSLKEKKDVNINAQTYTDDFSISELTFLDVAALILKKPISNKPFVNETILNLCQE